MINLIPNNLRTERKYGRYNFNLIHYIGLLAGAALLTIVIVFGNIASLQKQKSDLQESIKENTATIENLQKSTADVDKLVDKITIVDTLYEQNIEFSKLIPDIGALLPEGTVLNSLSLTGGSQDPLTLSIDIKRPELAATLVKNLTESGIFEAADIGSITTASEDYPYTATITAQFIAQEKEVVQQ